MEFNEVYKKFFNAQSGAFSKVTIREYEDSQITLDEDEKQVGIPFWGKENILIGNKASNPEKAAKTFLLYPELTPITLNVLYPKPQKTELRLYLSEENGFKPEGNDVWFIFLNNDSQLVIGAMQQDEWDEIGLVQQMSFKPRARLLLQLGDQLIKNETIAITELVKNAYDADASYCKVIFENVDAKSKGFILIDDDGWGMDLETIKNSWLEPGSDSKETIIKNKHYSDKGRLPIGEKGIGRFGVHKLGRDIELVTRKAGNKEVVVKINWENFSREKYLDDAFVTVYEREPKIFTEEQTGTRIIIKKLPIVWTRGKLRDAFRAINAISTPSTYDVEQLNNNSEKQINSFDAVAITNLSDWVKDIPKWQDIIQYSLFYFDIEILNDKVTKFRYRFKPWDSMSQITGTDINETENPVNGLLDIEANGKKKFEPLFVPNHIKIGVLKFQGCIFIRDRSVLKAGIEKPTFLTDYLNENGGIRVYRDGLRVYDYGERGNDWLSLDYRRFNDPGVKISNNLILASITLNREDSSSLVEKTNREGFIENEAYEIFQQQILYALRLIEICREQDKKKIDAIYKPKIETESVLSSINSLRNYIDEKVKDQKTNSDLKFYIKRVEDNYKVMYERLIKSANAGMGWGIYIHEIEKIIKEIEKSVGKESTRAVKLVSHLSKLIENYSQILRKSTQTKESLKTVIEQSIFNAEYRFGAHKIQVVEDYPENIKDHTIKISRSLIISTLMNIYDNSIYWLDRANRIDKKMRISVSNEKEGFISIVVSDNGTGFLLNPDQMTEPLVSARGGMGMGLYLANEVMKSHNNSILSFNENGEFDIPDEYKLGATVALCFRK